MYCPKCGQQQISDEMRFCSRCGLALSGLAEWVAGGAAPAKRKDKALVSPSSPRRKGSRTAKLMFLSGVLFPFFLVLSLLVDDGGLMAIPFILFFVSFVIMIYKRLFSDKTPSENSQDAQTYSLASMSTQSSLPPASNIPMPAVGRQQVRTNELAQPPSVTEHTTRLLDDESS
jgi:zinc-ribbon domain